MKQTTTFWLSCCSTYCALLLTSASTEAFVIVPTSRILPPPSCRRSSSFPPLSVAVDTSDIKNGMTLELDDGEPYKVVQFSVMKQARGAAKMTIKFKNLVRGNTIENTYRSGEKFETATIEKTEAQFTYKEGVRTGDSERANEIANELE